MLPLPARKRKGWQAITLPSWVEFRRQWWGAAGSERLRLATHVREPPMLTIEQPEVFSELNVLVDTGGTMYLREEITFMYERVLGAYDKLDKGVVYTGMPKVGKSCALVYMLLCRMAAGRPVMFSTDTGKTFIFDDEGIWSARTTDCFRFPHKKDVYRMPGTRMWSLVDHPASSPYNPHVYVLMTGSLFPVHVVRCDASRYGHWSKAAMAREFHLEPWNAFDLARWSVQCSSLVSAFSKFPEPLRTCYSTEKTVADVLAVSGPTPSETIEEMTAPGCTKTKIVCALQAAGLSDLKSLGYHSIDPGLPKPLGDLLLLWKRHRPPSENGKSDLVESTFKNDLVYTLLVERLAQLHVPTCPTWEKDKPAFLLGVKAGPAADSGVCFDTA